MTNMPQQRFVFQCLVEKVIDGDTLDVIIDQGMHNRRIERIRLLNVNTPEMKGESKAAGTLVKGFVTGWISEAQNTNTKWPIIIETEKADAFGRYLATIWSKDTGECLNDLLIANGMAIPYERR